ncbi:MAG: hypothetical protein A2X94_11290 [Bdellovibrionales bacterium GWB1_55_8]|nr:MAG: hypothetical protein A2X94_11290 [Bdellovibrionales bacterium GWB1_55_8]
MTSNSTPFTQSDSAELAFRVELLSALVTVFQMNDLDLPVLAKHARLSESDLKRIQEGNSEGISTDSLIRILGAAGYLTKLTVSRIDQNGI